MSDLSLTYQQQYERAWDLRRSDAPESLAAARSLFAQAESHDSRLPQAQARLVLAVHAGYAGRLQECLDGVTECFAAFEQHGDFISQIRACNVMGYVHIVRNDLAKAFEVLLRGLLLSRDYFVPDMQIYFLYNLGEIYKNTLRLYEKALPYLQEALEVAAKTDPGHALVAGLHASLALCLQKTGRGDLVAPHVEQALTIATQTDDQQTLSICYHMLALTALENQDLADCRAHVEREYALLERIQDAYALSNTRLVETQLLLAENRPLEVIPLAASALKIAEEGRFDSLVHHFNKVLAEAFFQTNQFEQAAQYYRQYAQAFERTLTLEVENRISLMSTEVRIREQAQALQANMREVHMAALTELVNGVAHEINTPLGNAVTMASFLESELDQVQGQAPLEKTRNGLVLLQSNLNKAASIVDRFKKVAMNYHDLDLAAIKVNPFLGELAISARALSREGRIRHDFGCPDSMRFESYKSLLSFALLQLIENAERHAFPAVQEGGPGPTDWTVSITARDSDHDPNLVIVVADNGVGIPAANLERIFHPFFTTKKARGGLGLGLNIVYNIVTQVLRGKIEVHSREGAGTTFTLRLPKRMPLWSGPTGWSPASSFRPGGTA